MNPIYEKCYKNIITVNKESLPKMGMLYHNYVKNINRTILENECLNDSRRVTKSALEAIDYGYLVANYSNKNVCIYLEALSELSKDMNKKSYILKDKLVENQEAFRETSKILSHNNHELMLELKEGNTPADELLGKISKLDKAIQDVCETDIPQYANSIKIYLLSKIEQEICQEVSRYESEIERLDSGTLMTVVIDHWTDYVPIDVLGSKIPFNTAKEML